MKNRPIFIAGTGRCGSSLLLRIVGTHPEVYAFKKELRILTDHHGLLPLLDALSTRYTPVRAREALYAFERFLKYDITTPERTPYKDYDLREEFGTQYDQVIDRFIAKVTLGSFEEHVGQRSFEETQYATEERNWIGTKKYTADYSHPASYVARFFTDRSELETIAKEFLTELFDIPTKKNGMSTWCEKTPANLDNMLDLISLFPEALHVHIKRDPRGVCYSMMNQDWAPSSLSLTAGLLNQVYAKWYYTKQNLPVGARVIEVKLEDLNAKPKEVMALVAEHADMTNDFPGIAKLKDDKVDYWKERISSQDLSQMNELLGEAIERMGYSKEL